MTSVSQQHTRIATGPIGTVGTTASTTAPTSGGSSTNRVATVDRERFVVDELAIVLSNFDIGIIDAIQVFPRGSRKAPKLILKTNTGLYLLKRRARGKDDPYKVAFCHELQLYLTTQKFPLPHLIGTKNGNNSILLWKDRIYELFEFIRGMNFDQSLEATGDSGRILALFHKLLKDYRSGYEPPQGSYHASDCVDRSVEMIPRSLDRICQATGQPPVNGKVASTLEYLRESYYSAAARVNELGLPDWPMQIVHSDWHPGNMLFRGARVVAVIDYDAARIQQRVLDVANGALQFSIIGGGEDPSQWPDYLDEDRYKRFLLGYDSVPNCLLARAELRALPWLMTEALIAESVIPIAATGTFANMDGALFLNMVERKVRWLQDHAERLAAILDH